VYIFCEPTFRRNVSPLSSSQKTTFFMVTAVKTSDLIYNQISIQGHLRSANTLSLGSGRAAKPPRCKIYPFLHKVLVLY
jgi:hypothetical protein